MPVVKHGESLIAWKAKQQTTISRSSAKSEYKSIASTLSELIWIIGLFKEPGAEVSKPANLCYDSKAALQIATNPVYHEKTNI